MIDHGKALEGALKDLKGHSPDLLMHVLDSSPDNISISDAAQPDFPLTFVNPAFCETTGYSVEEVIGRNCRFLQGDETDPEHVSNLRNAISERRSTEVEMINYRKNGEPFVNALKLAPVFDSADHLVAYIGIQRDVTEDRLRQEREIGENRLEALGVAAGSIAHQLNNLLHPVVSLLSLHKDEVQDPDARKDLDIALLSARQAAEVSDYLLGLSRGRLTDEENATNVMSALERTIELAKLMIPPTVRITLDTGGIRPEHHIQINETLFAQVIINIVNNSAQATKQHGKILIEAAPVNETTYMISISDDGPGLPPALRKRVFDPFYTTKASKNGSGLGLSVVLQIINKHGGEIIVEDGLENSSARSRGCKFSLYLPYFS